MADDDIWNDDLLNRKQDADFLIDFLTRRITERREQGRSRSYVLNLNSSWGEGKTFFLTRLRRELERREYLCAYVNAWKDDHADDPLTAVISAIDKVTVPLRTTENAEKWDGVKKTAMKIAVAAGKGVATNLLRRVVGDAADEIQKLIGEAATPRDSSRELGFEKVDVDSLLESFLSRAGASLPQVTRRQSEPKSGKDRWIARVFDEEYALLYNNSYRDGQEPLSKLLEYPELVKNAGRLLATPATAT